LSVTTAGGRLGTAAKAGGGFVLGALMAVFLLPLAFAIALVLGGVVAWSRLRGEDDQQVMTPVAVAFVAAVAAYVVLLLVASFA
jgi:hypothetical protein